jgi:hypothetical protein
MRYMDATARSLHAPQDYIRGVLAGPDSSVATAGAIR